jgi:hypothetical protein
MGSSRSRKICRKATPQAGERLVLPALPGPGAQVCRVSRTSSSPISGSAAIVRGSLRLSIHLLGHGRLDTNGTLVYNTLLHLRGSRCSHLSQREFSLCRQEGMISMAWSGLPPVVSRVPRPAIHSALLKRFLGVQKWVQFPKARFPKVVEGGDERMTRSSSSLLSNVRTARR